MDATWILVIEIFADRIEGSRTRGLTEAACLTLLQEVKGPSTIAYCYPDGTKDPEWWPFRRPIERPPLCAHGGGSCAWPILPWAPAGMMDEATFTLIVLLRGADGTISETSRPGLTETECRAAEVMTPTRYARCEAERWYPVICPFAGGCWRNGRKCLDGALCRELE